MTQRRNCSAANPRTEARYKLDQLRRAADDGLPVITRDRTVAELLDLWRTKALPNRDLSPARIASHGWAIRVLTHELGTIRLQALTVGGVHILDGVLGTATPSPEENRAKDHDALPELHHLRGTASEP